MTCDFCHGKPVVNGAGWVDGKPRPPAACPRCGEVNWPDSVVQDQRPPHLIPGAMQTVVERDLGHRGVLRFEEAPVGWLTKDGKPRRQDWRRYKLTPVDAPKALVLPSVSTVLGVLEKRALYDWHEAQGIAGALEAIRRGEINPDTITNDDAVTVVRDLHLGAEAAKLKAATRGKTIHNALEDWSRGEELPQPADMDIEHRPFLSGLAKALMDLDPEPVAVEQITCSPTHGVAGRFDLLARIGGQLTMCDLKTNKWGVGFNEAHPQAACYAACEQEITGLEIERMVVLGVGPGGVFRVDECCASFDDFLAIMSAYRATQRIGNARAALDRAAKAAA